MVIVLIFGLQTTLTDSTISDRESTIDLRERILAIANLKKAAPVEAHSGDVYFPENKLYLPNPRIPFVAITYLFEPTKASDTSSDLSVSTYPIYGTANLYAAQNTYQLFAGVPKLQACSRGVKLTYNKFSSSDDQNVRKHTVHLTNGRDMYIYSEKSAPNSTIWRILSPILKAISAYC